MTYETLVSFHEHIDRDNEDYVSPQEVEDLLRKYSLHMTMVACGDLDERSYLRYENTGFLFDLGGDGRDFALLRKVQIIVDYDDEEDSHFAYAQDISWIRCPTLKPVADILGQLVDGMDEQEL